MIPTASRVAVIGANGHTGRFVVAELRRRGLVPILSGRDADRLRALARDHPGAPVLPASVDSRSALDRLLADAAAVINCAGPFAATAAPVVEAALRARIPYLDVSAELEVIEEIFARYGAQARRTGVVIVPGMAFFGGLGDLLATVAMDDWTAADRISIAYALDSWRPTAGTRATGAVSTRRRNGLRPYYTDRRMEYRTGEAPHTKWTFPMPVGRQSVVAEFTTADSATIPTHLDTREIRTYLSLAAVEDLRSADVSPRVAVDASGRSAQTFLVEVVVARGDRERRAVARGRDIYAVTAPLVVEAAGRVHAAPAGVVAAGALGDAGGFLRALAPQFLTLDDNR